MQENIAILNLNHWEVFIVGGRSQGEFLNDLRKDNLFSFVQCDILGALSGSPLKCGYRLWTLDVAIYTGNRKVISQ